MARRRRRKYPTVKKAGTILRHGSVRGRRLTPRQQRFFGWIRGGRKRRARR